jgi:anti-anti-sigma factor
MELQPTCSLEVERRRDVIIARFTCEVVLSGQEAESAANQLTALLPELDQRRLLVDFGKVRSLTSIMIGELVRLNNAARAAGGQLALFNLPPIIREVMEVSQLNRIMSLYDDESSALHK